MYKALGNLSLDLLRAFEAAARHRSFTAAAMELGTTQPAVSQQIKRLEEQLAVRLFDRIYRGIELTDAGTLLFEQVQAGLQSIDTGLGAITEQDLFVLKKDGVNCVRIRENAILTDLAKDFVKTNGMTLLRG